MQVNFSPGGGALIGGGVFPWCGTTSRPPQSKRKRHTAESRPLHNRPQKTQQTADPTRRWHLSASSWGSLGPALSAEPKGLEGRSAFLEIVTVETTYIAQYQHTVLIININSFSRELLPHEQNVKNFHGALYTTLLRNGTCLSPFSAAITGRLC